MQYKNTPKIKVLQMSWTWNMIFCRIFKNFWHWEHTRGAPFGHEGTSAPTPLGRPPASWTPRGPPPLIPAPTHFVFLQKHPSIAQTRVLAHLAAIFDLFAQSSIHKTVLGDCSSVCDSSNGPISFCSSALFITIFCCLDDPVLCACMSNLYGPK